MGVGKQTLGGGRVLRRVKRLFRLKISAKIIVYFLYITLVPLLSVSFVLVNEANKQLLSDASSKQQAIAVDLGRRVDNYLANDVNQLEFVARMYATNGYDATQMDKTFTTLFNQNAKLQEVTLQTLDGNQRIFTRTDGGIETENSPIDLVNSKAMEFMVGKPYILSVGRDDKNKPQASIGIPILKTYGSPTNELFDTPVGTEGNVTAAIVSSYDISDLWQSVLSTKIGTGGYAYVVDKLGNLVAHPDRDFLSTHSTLTGTDAVGQFLAGNTNTKQTVSETGKDVVSTPQKTSTDWAVIVEEPVDSIYANIDSYVRLAAVIALVAVILSVLVGLYFSRQLIRPIQRLTQGAKQLGSGQFNQEIDLGTHDELQELAATFNGMAHGIKHLIGDLKTNNMRLKIEQMKLNNIISSVSDGIVAVNSKGEIISINPPAAKMLGKAPSEVQGALVAEEFKWLHDDEPFTPDFALGGIYHYGDLVLRRGETTLYMDVIVAVLEHQHSEIAAIVTIHDQTESRELSFMKLDFVAIAAHELRTPLTVVRGYLDILNTSGKGEMSVYNLESLQKAIVGADQLRDLINKLLNIARIERGDMEIFPEKLNLSELVRENTDQHQSVAGQKEQILSLTTTGSEGDIYVTADTASIVEVLNNLIGNALKYTKKNGTIAVELSVDDSHARVGVTDNGPGVPEDLRDRLFTKFYRAERSLIAGTRGTGLGLFISKTIIELQNGVIGIEPDSEHGSTFYFTLPLYDAERDDPIIAKKSSGGIRGWFKKRHNS
jgi:two-component system sensor histidine kinase VicK